jgi:phosphate starvation-inducible PhoH-like protein
LTESIEKRIAFQDAREMVAVLGNNDEYLRILQELPCQLIARGNELMIKGTDKDTALAEKAVNELLYLYRQGLPVTEHDVKYSLKLVREGREEELHRLYTDTVITTYRGKQVKAKTLGQWQYLKTIAENNITIAVGPAGTGKTYLAVAMAVKALKNREVERIILTRPAVEAGEKLGFLPGDLQEKVDPYLRPLYDALYEMLGMEVFQKHLTRGTIEVAPLAYMRGRTLNDAFIILDEAQNTTAEQMRMALTRFGFGSKLVVTGDATQIDLPAGKQSGLTNAAFVLRNIPGIGIIHFTESDVIRHEIVAAIIKAYQHYDEQKKKKSRERRDGDDRHTGK